MVPTSPNAASAIVKLVAADALPALLMQLIVGNLVVRDFEPTTAQLTDVVDVPIPYQPAPQCVYLDRHAEASFSVPDVLKALTFPELLRAYLLPAVAKIGVRIETDLLSLPFSTTLKPAQAALSEDVICGVDDILFNAIPSREARPQYLVCDPGAYSAIRQIPRFSEYYSAGEAGLMALIEGNVGKIGDVYVLRSTNVPAENHCSENLMFVREAMVLASRRVAMPLEGTGVIGEYSEVGTLGLRVTMPYEPGTLAQNFTIDVLYGCAIANRKLGVKIRTKV